MRKWTFILTVLIPIIGFCQGDYSTYPTKYFRNPLDIPLVLAGTFGELRSDHFHAGLDIKTQQKEGLRVYAVAGGYVSRIKISHWSYGKTLYVTHPNGYTSVYAHLKKFNKRIESYIKKRQYKKESFEIQVHPSENILPVKKSEVIAFSGSTGGFVAPHLHFEIRNTQSEKPINPLLFGIKINDGKLPRINTLLGYALDSSSQINGIATPSKIAFRKLKNGNLIANTIKAQGKIGFGINVYDQLDGAYNKNGIYSLEMWVNGKKMYDFKAGTFSFSESKYINLLIDYKRFKTKKQHIHKCFIEPLNKLSLYGKSIDNGYITIKNGLNYTVHIIAKDFKGNKQKITIPIIGKKTAILVQKEIKKTPYPIASKQFHKFSKNGVSVAFPKNTFYKDFYLDFLANDSIAQIHRSVLPLHKKYTLTFDVSKYTEKEKKQLYIASINKKGKNHYVKTVKKTATFYTTTKKLGNFALLSDTIKPSIHLKNFKDKQWLTHYKVLEVRIDDDASGIKSYRGEIDGKWVLMEFNVKRNLLTYNLNDKKFTKAKHHLKIEVTDNAGNTNTLNSTFFRKK